MKFLFFASHLQPLTAQSAPENLPDLESRLLMLARTLVERHQEVVIVTSGEGSGVNPRFISPALLEKMTDVDIYISVKDWIPLFHRIPTKRRFLWIPDMTDEFSNIGLGDRRVAGIIDALILSHEKQADRLCDQSGFPREKSWCLQDAQGQDKAAWAKVADKFLAFIQRLNEAQAQ